MLTRPVELKFKCQGTAVTSAVRKSCETQQLTTRDGQIETQTPPFCQITLDGVLHGGTHDVLPGHGRATCDKLDVSTLA